METILNSSILKLGQIQNVFAERLELLESELTASQFNGPIFRLEIAVESVDILGWLSTQISKLVYWSNREGTFEMGGVGIADAFVSDQLSYTKLFQTASQNLNPKFPHLRYYGGCAFDAKNMGEEWKEFKACQFWVPAFEIVNSSEGSYFACNIVIRKNIKNALKKTLKDFQELKFNETAKDNDQSLISRRDFPDQSAWQESFASVFKKFQKKLLAKVVLARKTVLKFNKDLNPFIFLKDLNVVTPHCFHFCFQPTPGISFTGASPERLYLRNQYVLKTEAVAGTRKRGSCPEQEANLEKEFLSSSKDHQEHLFVVNFIKETLSKLCLRYHNRPLEVLKLQESMHLLSEFEGHLKENISDKNILEILHPTPAVAGTPTDAAISLIRHWEPFNRGWYAGTIGYIGHASSEFAVGIRCGLIRKNIIALYSGAGIIQESHPPQEWNETENKISGFLKILQK